MKRANDETQKRERRRVILESALALFEASDGMLSTVSAIADRAGIAKGTVYLYFRTREEIYLALLESFMDRWFSRASAAVEGGAGFDEFVETTCSFIGEQPVFMKLASIFNGILEKNVSDKTAYAFKLHLRDQVLNTAELIHSRFDMVPVETAARLILRSFAVCIGLWQIAEPAPVLKKFLDQDEMRLLKVDFNREVRESIFDLWAGVLN